MGSWSSSDSTHQPNPYPTCQFFSPLISLMGFFEKKHFQGGFYWGGLSYDSQEQEGMSRGGGWHSRRWEWGRCWDWWQSGVICLLRACLVFMGTQQWRGKSLCCPVCCTSHHPSEEPGIFSRPKSNCVCEENLADSGWGEASSSPEGEQGSCFQQQSQTKSERCWKDGGFIWETEEMAVVVQTQEATRNCRTRERECRKGCDGEGGDSYSNHFMQSTSPSSLS